MSEVLFELPQPSTALESQIFEKRLGRLCALTCTWAAESSSVTQTTIMLKGVEAFKCTYYRAFHFEKIRSSYDKLVNVGASDFLSDITDQLTKNKISVKELKHLMITFDDGPCYEFICKEFHIE